MPTATRAPGVNQGTPPPGANIPPAEQSIYDLLVRTRGLTNPSDLATAKQLATTIAQSGYQITNPRQVNVVWDVNTAYQQAFGRPVDPSGLKTYAGKYANTDVNMDELMTELKNSPEGQQSKPGTANNTNNPPPKINDPNPPAVNGLSAQQVIDAYKSVLGPDYSPTDQEIALGRAGYLTLDALKSAITAAHPPKQTGLNDADIIRAWHNKGLPGNPTQSQIDAFKTAHYTSEELDKYLTTQLPQQEAKPLDNGTIIDTYQQILGRNPTASEVKDAIAVYPDVKRLTAFLNAQKPSGPQGVQKLDEEELKRIVTQGFPNFTPITTDLSKTSDLILEKQRATNEQFTREQEAASQKLRDLLAGQRTEEANRIGELQSTQLPKFVQAQEPLLQQQLAQTQQSGASNLAAAEEQLRKQYAASGRDPDLAQSGALTSTFGQLAGQTNANQAQAEAQLRQAAAGTANTQLQSLIEAERARSAQERQIQASSYAGEQSAANQLYQASYGNIAGDLRQQQQQKYDTEKQTQQNQFTAYQNYLTREFDKQIAQGKMSQEDKNGILGSIGSIFGSLANLGSMGTTGILSQLLGGLGLTGAKR